MTSQPISDLSELLASLQPELHPGTWAWCALPTGTPLGDVDAVAIVHEVEGLTVVVAAADARRRDWNVIFHSAWITLRVHSDLAAVGLTAAFASVLGDAGISCNVIAGAYHDHLFVPVARAADALAALQALQTGSAA